MGLSQLYQGLDSLQPAPEARQQKAWSRLEEKLKCLGLRPVPRQEAVPGAEKVLAALTQLGLAFNAHASLGCYRVVALLQSQNQVESPLVLTFNFRDHISSQPGRYVSP